MTYPRGSPVLIVTFLVMFLAACGSTASSVTSTATATAAALVKGEFVGDAGHLAGIGLSPRDRPPA